MVKVFKQKDKLIAYLPFDVTKELKLEEGDEIEFFRYKPNLFLVAKKQDMMDMLLGSSKIEETRAPEMPVAAPVPARGKSSYQFSQEELIVLRKLDTLRYQMRTKENVERLLNSSEKQVLAKLLVKKAVSFFGKDGTKPVYGISKSVYEQFLMRKGKTPETMPKPNIQQPQFKQNINMNKFARNDNLENDNVKSLEAKGFIVLQTEGEATSLSLILEDSIRHGQVLGTRSFNKKFYIVLRTYFDRYNAAILKALREGKSRVDVIASSIRIDEDGTRAILYLLSENGDVSEKRRDVFAIA